VTSERIPFCFAKRGQAAHDLGAIAVQATEALAILFRLCQLSTMDCESEQIHPAADPGGSIALRNSGHSPMRS